MNRRGLLLGAGVAVAAASVPFTLVERVPRVASMTFGAIQVISKAAERGWGYEAAVMPQYESTLLTLRREGYEYFRLVDNRDTITREFMQFIIDDAEYAYERRV